MIMQLLALVVSTVWFQFAMWKSSRETTNDKQKLMSYIWIVPVLFFVVTKISYFVINTDTWLITVNVLLSRVGVVELFSGMLAVLLFTLYYCYYTKWKVWAFLDNFSMASAGLLLMGLVANFSIKMPEVTLSGCLLVSLVLTAGVKNKYRSFSWYPSGKKGFVFCWLWMWYFFLAGMGYFVYKPSVWLPGTIMMIVGLVFGFILIYLGESKLLAVFMRRKK